MREVTLCEGRLVLRLRRHAVSGHIYAAELEAHAAELGTNHQSVNLRISELRVLAATLTAMADDYEEDRKALNRGE